MHSYSVKLYGNKQRKQVNNDCALYLLVIINTDKYYLKLDIKWNSQFIDNKAGAILERSKPDIEFSDYNMIIQDRKGKVNDIFKTYRLQDRILTVELFKKEYQTFELRKDFLIFMQNEIDRRYNEGEIKNQTWKNNRNTLSKLQLFKNPTYFYHINAQFLNTFSNFLRNKHSNSDSTVWGAIKDVNTYLQIAKSKGIFVDEDHKNHSSPVPSGRVIYLEEIELKKLHNLFYDEQTLTDPVTRQCLRIFLFQCFSSLRISDAMRASWNWVNNNNEMVFIAKKSERFKKEVTVPLGPIAMALIEKKKGLFFNSPAEQTINEKIKECAEMVNIRKNISTHVGRHTFGTLFYRHTKDILSLSKIMGHSKLQTTMIYAHINDQDKKIGLNKYEDAFNSI